MDRGYEPGVDSRDVNGFSTDGGIHGPNIQPRNASRCPDFQSSSGIMDPAYDASPETELPSCSGCRKRKLKCSRQKPACSNCDRLQAPCIYEARRNKPGLKSGAVESLNQRLEKVERALFGQAHPEGSYESGYGEFEPPKRRTDIPSPLEAVLSTLTDELHKLNRNIAPPISGRAEERQEETSHVPRNRKRKRHEGRDRLDQGHQVGPSRESDIAYEVLDELLDAYFSHVQPWIPMIRESSFRQRLQQGEDQGVSVILQAMAVAALRKAKAPCTVDRYGWPVSRESAGPHHYRLYGCKPFPRGQDFADVQICDGNLEKAWPIIGSLTRTVEYMELSVEAEDRQHRPAVLPSPAPLPPPRAWIEEEERRRVFWNIFILDRFSSVVKGWNTSLTAADVCRRLPICGGKWYEDEPSVTPYFGIWDRSRAKMGNSITFLPGHYPSPSHSSGEATDLESGLSSGQRGPSNAVDMSMVGAFAYYVESIESLSQITTYFLQTKIDFDNRQEVSSWLTRFKELDLRLVHWKMYLPQHWKDSGVSRETMPGVMDPNMTVANATHNISLILLHERIAYPDAELNGVRLPSLCSADTCYSAATETANITTKYLEGPSRLPVSPHLGICAFVSGRVLLVHWRYYGGKLADEFQVLVENLGEMSRRWAGCQAQQPNQQQQACLFSQLADRLNNLYRESSQESGHASLEPFGIPTESRPPPQSTANTQMYQENPRIPTLNLTSQLPGLNHMDQITEPGSDERNPKVPQSNTRDELSAISQILMDNDFLEMDRIISFEDMMSAGDLSHAML
ncbi:hypothetical protein ACJZ2D_014184 [Fusarium nematophilum]